MTLHRTQLQRLTYARQVLTNHAGQQLQSRRVISTGIAALDAVLPEGGIPAGAITELISPRHGEGAMTLALFLASCAVNRGQHVVFIDRTHAFYPPAAVQRGLDLACLTVIRPSCRAHAIWACEESLRCHGVGAVVAAWNQLSGQMSRRFQRAAELGGSLGLIVRTHDAARNAPSLAAAQLSVTPLVSNARHPQFTVVVRKARAGWAALRQFDDRSASSASRNDSLIVTLNYEAGLMSLSATTAHRARATNEQRARA